MIDPPVCRPARSASIITKVDAELVAVSSSICGSSLDDCSPAAYGLGVPGAAAMRFELRGGAEAAASAHPRSPLLAWAGRLALLHEACLWQHARIGFACDRIVGSMSQNHALRTSVPPSV